MVGNIQEKKNLIEAGIFLLKVNMLLIPFYIISYTSFAIVPLQAAFASLIAFILRLFNISVMQNEQFLYLGQDSFPVNISFDCLGWKSMYSLSALVIATPGDVKNKMRFLKVWLPVLFGINIFRILSTIAFGNAFGYQYVEFIHNNIWQVAMIALVIVIWYRWLKKK